MHPRIGEYFPAKAEKWEKFDGDDDDDDDDDNNNNKFCYLLLSMR